MVHTSVCFPPLNSKQVENIISFLYFIYFCTLRQITKIRAQAHFFFSLSYPSLYFSRGMSQGFRRCVLFNNRRQHRQSKNIFRLFFLLRIDFSALESARSLLDVMIILHSLVRCPGSSDAVPFICHHSHVGGQETAF